MANDPVLPKEPTLVPLDQDGVLVDRNGDGRGIPVTPERFLASAQAQGVDPATLWARMQQQGIEFRSASAPQTPPPKAPVAENATPWESTLADRFQRTAPVKQTPLDQVIARRQDKPAAVAEASARAKAAVEANNPATEIAITPDQVPDAPTMAERRAERQQTLQSLMAHNRAQLQAEAPTHEWNTAMGRNLEVPAKRGYNVAKSGAAGTQIMGLKDEMDLMDQLEPLIAKEDWKAVNQLLPKNMAQRPRLAMYVREQDPAQRAKLRVKMAEQYIGEAEDGAEAQAQLRTLPQNPKLREAMASGEAGAVVKAIIADPSILTDTAVESLVASGVGIASAPLTGPVGLGVNALMNEYGNTVFEALSEEGIDVTKPDAIVNALADEERWQALHTRGLRKGVPVTVMEILAGGLASKVLAPAKFMGKSVSKGTQRTVDAAVSQPVTQGAAGATGEFAGSMAATGEANAAEVMLEGLAETTTTPVEVAAVRAQTRREAREAKTRETQERQMSRVNKIRLAAKSGDMSTLKDDPRAEVQARVWRDKNANLSPADKEANLQAIDAQVGKIEQQLKERQTKLKDVDPARAEANQAELERINQELTGLSEDDERYRALALRQAELQTAQEYLAEATPKRRKELEQKARETERELDIARQLRQRAVINNRPEAEELQSLLDQLEGKSPAADSSELIQRAKQNIDTLRNVARGSANPQDRDADLRAAQEIEELIQATEQGDVPARERLEELYGDISDTPSTVNPEAQQAVAAKVVALAQRDPEALSPEQAQALADNPNNGLNGNQRNFLRKFSKARIAANKLATQDSTRRGVFQGTDGFKGLNQYREDVSRYLDQAELESAQDEVAQLERFVQSHTAKAAAVETALSESRRTGKTYKVVRDAEDPGSWRAEPGKLSRQQREESGSLNVDARYSADLAESLRQEAQAVQAAAEELNAALALHTQAATEESTGETANESTPETPAGEPASAEAEETPEPATQEPGAREGAAETAPVAEGAVAPEPDADPETEAEAEPTHGRLKVYKDAQRVIGTVSTEVYKTLNLVTSYLFQKRQKDTEKTARPLVAEANFLSQLQANPQHALAYLDQPEGMTEAQQTQLENLIAELPAFNRIVQELIEPDDNKAFYHQRFIQFLIDKSEDPAATQLEENVLSAVSLAAYSTLAENGKGFPWITSKEELNALLHRPDNASIARAEWETFAHGVMHDKLLINQLGQRAVQALGFKLRKDAPKNTLVQLEQALGAHALALLLKTGAVERANIEVYSLENPQAGDFRGVRLEPFTGQNGQEAKRYEWPMVRIAQGPDGEPVTQASRIYEAGRNTQGLLSRLFGIEQEALDPSVVPQDFTATTTKNTDQKIPSMQREILDGENRKAHKVRQTVQNVYGQLTPALRERIAGVVGDSKRLHAANEKRQAAKDDALRRELADWDAFVAHAQSESQLFGLDQAYFLTRSVWKQQRVGLENRINPQTSKIHRFLLGMDGWQTTVDLQDPQMVARFELVVAAGLGIKTDKVQPELALAQYEAKLQENPVINRAVELLQQVEYHGHTLTDANQAVIAEAVEAGGEAFHSLDALVNLAHQREAVNRGETHFTTDIFTEVDGITNGPMLSLLFFGAMESRQALWREAQRGGFYPKGSEYDNYVDWKGADTLMQDLYEHQGQLIKDSVERTLQQSPALVPIYGAIFRLLDKNFVGEITISRNLVKTPLTAMAFGSSITNGVDSMAEELIQAVYDRLEDIANDPSLDPDTQQAQVSEILRDVQTLIGWVNPKLAAQIDPTLTLEEALQASFSRQDEKALKKAFRDSFGQDVKTSLEEKFHVLLGRRNRYNQAAQTAFELYHQTYQLLRERLIKEKIKQEELAYREGEKTGKVPLQDLTEADEHRLQRQLKKLLPQLHTYFSKQSGELEAGLLIAKGERSFVGPDNLTYSNQARFPKYQRVPTNNTDHKAPLRAINGRGFERTQVNPGVAMGISSIHSSDSAIAALTYAKFQALNIHDALGTGLNQLYDVAKGLNQNTFEVLLEYSPGLEFLAALERTVEGFVELLAENPNDPALLEAYARVGQSLIDNMRKADKEAYQASDLDPVSYVLKTTREEALQAEEMKLSWLSELKSINQYGLADGYYTLTEADYARIEAKQAELNELIQVKGKTGPGLTTFEKAKALGRGEVPVDVSGESPTAAEEGVEGRTLETAHRTSVLAAIDSVKRRFPKFEKSLTALEQALTESTKPIQTVIDETLTRGQQSLVLPKITQLLRDTKLTVWGTPGTPARKSHPGLVQFLENPENRTAGKLLQYLSTMNNVGPFRKALIQRLMQSVPKDLPIQYVTPDTPVSEGDAETSTARGWYSPPELGEKLVLRAPLFVESGLTVGHVLHELTHAATYLRLQRARQRKNSPEYRVVEDLEILRDAAATFIAQDTELKNQWAHATSSVDELLSYGLTNKRFQDQVLKQVQVKQRTYKSNKLVSGLRAFIQSLTQLLFGEVKPDRTNGLYVLIENAAALTEIKREAQQAHLDQALAERDTGPADTDRVEQYTHAELFDSLDQGQGVRGDFATHLKDLLGRVVNQLYGPAELFKRQVAEQLPDNPAEVWLWAKQQGRTPFVSQVLSQALPLTDQEQFVIEQLEAVGQATLDPRQPAYRELRELHAAAKAQLKDADFFDGDFSQASPAEQEQAAAERRALLGYGQANYLTHFLALGLGSQKYHALLSRVRSGDTRALREMPLTDRLKAVFDRLLRLLRLKAHNVRPGHPADRQLKALLENLVQVESRYRHRVKTREVSKWRGVEEWFDGASDRVRERITQAATEGHWSEVKNKAVSTAVQGAAIVAGNRVEPAIEFFQKVRNKRIQERQGVVAALFNELKGTTDSNAVFYKLLRMTKRLEVNRKKFMTEMEKLSLGFFNRKLKDAEKTALTRLMRLDLGLALEDHTAAEIQQWLEKPSQLTRKIKDVEAQLAQVGSFKHYYRFQAENLGHYLATGKFTAAGGRLNAYNIARAYGTGLAVDSAQSAEAEPLIDLLATLYGIQYMSSQDRQVAVRLFQDDAEGSVAVMKLHRSLQAEARETLFEDDPVHFAKGHTAEIVNPHRAIQVADAQRGAELEAQGWRKLEKLESDPHDPTRQGERHIYLLPDGGLQPRVTGIASNTADQTKGDPLATHVGVRNHILKREQAEVRRQLRGQASFDPKGNSRLVAVFDRQGQITNYRYLMGDRLRDAQTVLQRDNRFEKVLGAMAGRMVDKQTNLEQNEQLIQALKEQYDADYALNPEAYVEVSATAADLDSREAYKLLPAQTQHVVRQLWGTERMYVRNDVLNITLGYRKFSLADWYTRTRKQELELEQAQQVGVDVMNWLLEQSFGLFGGKGKTALNIRRTENVVHEIAMMTKDFLVVKNPVTWFFNFTSAISQLMWHGVPPDRILKGTIEAIQGTMDYQRDYGQLIQLRNKLAAGLVDDVAEAEENIRLLELAIERNPMKPLIDAGMMQTIVEDVEADEEAYTYQSQLMRKVDGLTQKLPRKLINPAVTAVKYLVMAHDTPLYKFMSQNTMMVDLAARYVLHNWQTTRPKNPMSQEESFRRVYEEFVAYDVPQHKALQYLDDMGLLRFTKYYVRIQKVLFRMFRENPARTLMMLTLGNWLDLAMVSDGNVLEQAGNPLKGSVLDFPGAVPEALTFQTAAALVP